MLGVGCNPVWNDKFVFNVQDASSEQLALTIRNDNFTEEYVDLY